MPLSEFPRALRDDSSEGAAPPDIRVEPPGPLTKALLTRLAAVECPAFGARRDARDEVAGEGVPSIVYSTARGSNVFDADDNRYVDFVAGFGALPLGHGSKTTKRALEAQSERLLHALGDVYSSDTKVALLERLARLLPNAGGTRVLLTQSGSDAVTAALKTAKLATGKPGVVAFEGAYHGLGNGPLAACGLRESLREPFADQLNPHVTFAPYPKDEASLGRSLEAVRAAVAKGNVGAIVVEPILGRGGCVVPPPGFLRALAEIAKESGAVFIADEIWTGLGRSGAMLASTAEGVTPDVVCLGKALGGGISISACIAKADVMAAWSRGGQVLHTSTHAGSPLACAAAIATLSAIEAKGLAKRANEIGTALLESLREAVSSIDAVVEARGRGLLIGVELASASAAQRVVGRMLTRGYIVLSGGKRGETITLTPALTIDERLFPQFVETFADVLREA